MATRTMSMFVLAVVCGLLAATLAFPTYLDEEEEYREMVKALEKAKASRINNEYAQPRHAYFPDLDGGDNDEAFDEGEPEHGEEKTLVHEEEEEEEGPSGYVEAEEDWPAQKLKIGQVGGLAVGMGGQPHVFHRADRVWNDGTFDDENKYNHKEEGPIKAATVLMLNKTDGAVLSKWGENMFYMPHGFTIDSEGNFWMTDVASHQVYKVEKGKTTPSLVLGKPFEPAVNNADLERFCKPTDVAVASNGDFFVSDGYCNSRVMKFDKEGKFLGKFGDDEFFIPHSLALAEDLDVICVADRENMRIMCFNAGLKDAEQFGAPEMEFASEMMGRVYAISYSQPDGLLYAVTGRTGALPPQGFTIDLKDEDRFPSDFVATWGPDDNGFENPHDLAVSPDGNNVYVGEIGPNLVWKFDQEE